MPSCLKACDFTQINGKWTAFIWHYPSLINHSKRFALHATFAHTHTHTVYSITYLAGSEAFIRDSVSRPRTL